MMFIPAVPLMALTMEDKEADTLYRKTLAEVQDA
jgi:hypothetical protein